MSSNALNARWKTDSGQALAEDVIARLIAARPLNGLGLSEHDGRIDLRSLPIPAPRRLQRFEAAGWFVERLGDLVVLRGAHLQRLDFSGAQLQSLRIHDSVIKDCRFDRANCRDWRLWGTEVSDSSFANASLRESAVGTWDRERRNVWRRVNFSGSDFRVGVSQEAVYEDCDFLDAQLENVEFGQCAFARCRFAGELKQVVFDGRNLNDRPAPPQMEAVDFSDAFFRHVEFMGFDLKA